MIVAAVDVDGSELLQVPGGELGVEQPEPAGPEPRHEVDQRDLRGVPLAAEHALAEERRAEH